MKELLWQDFLTMGKTLKAYSLFLCLCLMLAVPGILQLPLVTAMISMILILLPIGMVFWDGEEKPLCRRGVLARYLLVLLMAVLAAAFSLSAGVFLSIVGDATAEESLTAVLATISTGVLIAAILLPVRYRLGAQRARPFLYPVILVPLAALFRGYTPGYSKNKFLSLPAAGGLCTVALLGLGISCVLSCRIADGAEGK